MERNQATPPESPRKKSIPYLLGQLGLAYLEFVRALAITAREELPPRYRSWQADRQARNNLDDKVE